MSPAEDRAYRFGFVGWLAASGVASYLVWLLLRYPTRGVMSVWVGGLATGLLCSLAASRARASRSWRAFVSGTADVHVLGAALLCGLAFQQDLTEGITSDGCLYLAHLRSLIFDGDLQIDPELRFLRLPPRPHHVVPVGPAIVWAPLYSLVALADWMGQSVGAWMAPTYPRLAGLTEPYQAAVILSSVAIAAGGLMALHLRLRREFGRFVALVTSLLLAGATPLAWYAIFEPAMTHAASFGLVALFVVASDEWLRRSEPGHRRALLLGVLLGLLVLVRPQDALFLIFPIAAALAARRGRGGQSVFNWRLARWAAAGAAPLLLVQALMLLALLRDAPFVLMGSQGYLQPTTAHLLDVLFSPWHGLFTWSPVAYVCLIGTVFYLRRDRWWAVAALLVFVGAWWINSVATDWAGGWAFGGRRFTSTLVVLAPGLAVVVEFFLRRPMLVVAPLALLAIVWNYFLMAHYHVRSLPRDAPVSFEELMRWPASESLGRLARFYPFAFPANVWFAIRESVPVDRYDQLVHQPLAPQVDLVFDDSVDRFLLDGWQKPGPSEPGGYRWLMGRATLLVPLRLPEDGPVLIEFEARVRAEAGPVQVVIGVEVNSLPAGQVTVGPELSRTQLVVASGASGMRWREGFNRLTLTQVQVLGRQPDPRRRVAVAVHTLSIGPR